jgi:hypothetical protein
VVNPPVFGSFQGLANVRGGHGVAYFKAADDVQVGDVGEVTLEVRPPRSASLRGSSKVEVVDLPDTSGNDGKSAKTANINIVRVTKDEAFYQERGWDTKSVALVEADDESTNVFISMSNERLEKLIARAQRRDEGAVQAVNDFYVEHVSYFAVIDHLASQQQPQKPAEEVEGTQLRGDVALINACDTVCGIIESLFEVLAAGTSEIAV